MAKVLQLSRASIENAKNLYRGRLVAHLVTLAIGGAGIFTPDSWALPLGLLALVSEAVAWILNYYGEESHTLGRKGLRRAILMDSFGTSDATLDIVNFKRMFGSSTTAKAEQMDLSRYYTSTLDKGIERFRENLQESAFWTAHLFKKAFVRSLLRFLFFFLVSFAIVLATAPYLTGQSVSMFFRVIVLFLSFVPASEELRNMLAWWAASHDAATVRDRLEGADLDAKEQLLMIFGDYVSAVESAAPIPTAVHKKDHERLNKLWEEFKRPAD